MHRKTPKLPSAPAGAHISAKQRFRHGHVSAEHVGGSKRMLLPLLLVAQLMVILDITAVNIALPSLSRDLDISGSSISWTITSYSLIFGSLLLFGGRAADLLGRLRARLRHEAGRTSGTSAAAVAGATSCGCLADDDARSAITIRRAAVRVPPVIVRDVLPSRRSQQRSCFEPWRQPCALRRSLSTSGARMTRGGVPSVRRPHTTRSPVLQHRRALYWGVGSRYAEGGACR